MPPDPRDTIPQIIERHAAAQARNIAFTFLSDHGDASDIDFGSLSSRIDQLAARLLRRLAPTARVLLVFPFGQEFVIAFFACLRAGMVAVPVSPPSAAEASAGSRRLRAIAADAGAALVLTTSFPLDIVRRAAGQATTLAALGSDDGSTALPPCAAIDADADALIQYSSGTTGEPKGVVLTHRNIAASMRMIMSGFEHDETTVFVSWLPHFHDMGLAGTILQPAFLGVRSVLMSPQSFLRRPSSWLAAISRYRATTSGAPDFAYDHCVTNVTRADMEGLDLSSWRIAFSGSEPVRQATMSRFAAHFAGCRFNAAAFMPCYGLAEATLLVANAPPLRPLRIRAPEFAQAGAAPQAVVGCGRPPPGVQIRIVEPQSRREVSPGQTGEIWVHADCVGRGYWNRPALSEEIFGAAIEGAGGRWLRSGDLGFLDHDELFVSARLKDLIIIHGRNIAPQDIEFAARGADPRFGRAAAAFQCDDGSTVLLVEVGRALARDIEAALVAPQTILDGIRARLHAELGCAVTTIRLVRSGTLEKTTSGKLRRGAIREAYLAGGHTGLGAAAPAAALPQTGLAARALALLANCLGVDYNSIDLTRPPLALGLDSLSATRFSARLEDELGIRLDAETILTAPSINTIIAACDTNPAPAPAAPAADARLGPMESAIWAYQTMHPRAATYNLALACRPRTMLGQETIAGRLAALVAAHPRLQARIDVVDGVPRWGQGDGAAIPCTRHARPSGGEQGLASLLEETALAPFDLRTGPCLRVTLIGQADTPVDVLCVTLHHIAGDLQSLANVITCLLAEDSPGAQPHHATLAGTAPYAPMPELVSAAPASLDLGIGKPPLGQSPRAKRRRFWFDAALSERLRRAAAAHRVTLASLLLAAYALLLRRHSVQADLRIGVPVSRRAAAGAGAIGCYIETISLEVPALDGQPASWFIETIAACLRDGVASAGGAVPSVAHTLFAFQQVQAPAALAYLLLGPAASPHTQSPAEPVTIEALDIAVPVSLMMTEFGGRIGGAWDCQEAVFDDAAARDLAARFACLLDSLCDCPSRPAGLLTLTPTPHVPPRPLPPAVPPWATDLAALLRHQAAMTPGRPAVQDDAACLTYAGLLSAAQAFRRTLPPPQAGGQRRIALIMPPGAPLVAAAFGAWLAGAAVVPLDASQPAERLADLARASSACCAVLDADSHGRLRFLLPMRQIVWDHEAMSLAMQSAPAPEQAAPADKGDAERLAWIIFTSGSTGVPKGVMVSHRGALVFGFGQSRRLALHPATRVLQLASPGFDAAFSDMLMALLCGGTLIVAPPPARLPGPELAELIGRERIGLLTASASLLSVLPPGDWPSLQAVISMAEACRPAVVAAWARQFAFYNGYGPTEATIGATLGRLLHNEAQGASMPAGTPFDGYAVYAVDAALQPLPPGAVGELVIAGSGLARGYLDAPAQTAERFVPDPHDHGARLYRTRDLGRIRADGRLECLGRADAMVKLRGYRIEPAEIEHEIERAWPGCRAAVGLAGAPGHEPRLVAFIAAAPQGADPAALRQALRARLPAHMIPTECRPIATLPLTPSGKLDQAALEAAPMISPAPPGAAGLAATDIGAVWSRVLGIADPDPDATFFELGGTSLMLPLLLQGLAPRKLRITDLLAYPTLRQLSAFLRQAPASPAAASAPSCTAAAGPDRDQSIAVLGYALRMPGAETPAGLWALLVEGATATRRFSRAELLAAGLDPALADDPRFVPVRGVVDGLECFDAGFFGLSAADAAILDPQHRLLLECAEEALQIAGYRDAESLGLSIGAFVGAGESHYAERAVRSRPELAEALGTMRIAAATDRSFAATQLGFRLDLTGPCVAIDTACSSSLVAVHQACTALLTGQCDVALAGGVSVEVPFAGGHRHETGHIGSASGLCRPFGAAADGTVRGMGGGLVVLRRLADALRDGDAIRAVILGSAINNDGAAKMGFSAPSEAGQARVIRAALRRAGVPAVSIGFVETHGTGTALGDAVELAALQSVYGAQPVPPQCRIPLGAAKANLGHLDTAAGVAGLIKACLTLEHRAIPKLPHAQAPHERLAGSAFRLPKDLELWPDGAAPRRAAVSSFGIGGTNAHLILEEAPPAPSAAASPSGPPALCLLSAADPGALAAFRSALAGHLAENPDLGIRDIACTLSHRPARPYRFAVAARDTEALREQLLDRIGGEARPVRRDAPVIFLYPGQGSLRAGAGAGLYAENAAFRDTIAALAPLAEAELGVALLPAFAPGAARDPAVQGLLRQTHTAQPLLFLLQCALTQAIRAAGLAPAATLGHSLGAYAAAVASGAAEAGQVLRLVAARGRLMQGCAPGAMLACAAPAERLLALSPPELELAAVNAPDVCMLSGPVSAIEAAARLLKAAGIACERLPVAHGFHSSAMEPAMAGLEAAAGQVEWRAPTIPFLSDTDGAWRLAAPDAAYWARHLRAPVAFHAALSEAAAMPGAVFLEVGAGRQLCGLVRRMNTGGAFPTLFDREGDEASALLAACAEAWCAGADLRAAAPGTGRRVPLPPSPFTRTRHWHEPVAARVPPAAPHERADPQDIAPPDAAKPQPRAGAGAALAESWAALLGGAPAPDDDFYEMGGDSLLAIRLCTRLSERLGATVDPGIVLSHPSFASLETALARHLAAPPPEPPARLAPCGEALAEPLSPAQLGIWAQHALEGGQSRHNLAVSLDFAGKLAGTLDCTALAGAIAALARRHPRLAAHVEDAATGPVLRHPAAPNLALEIAPVSDPEAAAALAESAGNQGFDLRAGPLARALLIPLRDGTHRLVFTLHHLVGDGASLLLLRRDLARAYNALARGAQPPDAPTLRPALTTPAADAGHLAYWAAILAGVEPPRLPFAAASASGGAADETRSADLARTLPGAVAASLRQRASAGRTTLFTLVCAAFKTVLHRATLQDDIALCSPVSLRASPADMQEVGLFVSLLPLRSRVAPSMRFSEMLATEATAIAGARSHLLPFEQILAASPLGQSKGNPFSIALGWQETAAAPEPFDGLSVSTSLISHLTTKFDLTLWAEDAADGLRLRLEYRRAVLGVAEAACLADALCALLNQLAAGADDPIEALSLASPEARRAVLHDWQGSRRAWPDPCLVPDAIAAQAASTPDRIALHEAETGRTMSYAALLNAADRLAAGLLSRGLAEESRIGVALPRGIPMAAALLGILRAGAAFVPLDPALPASRLHRMAARAGVAFVLGDKPDCLDADVPWAPPDTIATAPDAAAMPRLRAQSLAYVLFTSGSTGEPKGAMNEHGAFFNRLAWMIDTYGFSPADRVLQKTPLGFDVSLWEIFAPLMVGATVVLARQGGQADPAYLAETMRRARISIVHFVPSMLDAYLAAGARLPGLRLLVTSGEALSPSCAQRVLDLAPQTMRLANLYGPTEAAIDVTACDIDAACGSVPIGAPISNTRILILDRTGQPVPPGILGEILIGGIAAGRGYAGRPDLTADRFLPDPFATAPGARLYRTGDLGFWRADGRIAYAGRADQQVKLRGQRIELGEIAETLQRTGLIDSAASVVLDAGTPDARIATAVVPHAAIAGPITAWAQRMTACPVPPEAVFTAPDGTPLLHMNAGESRFLWQEIFEDRVYDVPGLALAPGDTVIDAGANIGMFALWAARRAPGIALYAYEPVPDVFAVLRANLQIHVPGARAFNLGLGARAAVARLAFFPRNTIISGLSADPSSRRAAIAHRLLRDAPELAVDSRRFAELLDHAMQMCEIDAQIATLGEQIALLGLDRIDLLKIDVEGAEEAVLDGLGDAGWRSIRQILIEASSSDGAAERIAHRLTARGYAVRTAPGNAGPGLILLHATAPSLRTVPAQPSCGQPSRGQPSRDLPRSAAALQQSLRAAIADNLPPVMQPASLTVLPSLPLLPSGKLDRASLAAVLAGTPADTAPRPVPVSADRPEPPPAHPLLGAILEVFAQTLPPPAPSEADAHFFRLGGHSLSAIRAVTALETRLGVRIGLQALMAHPVAAALAAHIATLQPAGQPTGTPAAEPNPDILPHPPVPAPHASPTHAPFPQTPIQQAYWIGRNAGLVLGNMATQGYIEIETDSLDIERLSEALRRLVARHPMLRAVATPDGQQRILDDVPVISLATEDLGGLAPAQLVAALEEKRRAMSHCVRDLTQWPLFDLAVSVCAADRYRLHLGLDAFAVDGASLRLLIRDLAEFYADPDVAMTPIGVTFEAYARALAASPAPPASRKYWLDRLPDLPPPPPLPYTTPLADIATPLVTRRALHLNPAETASLRAAAAAHGITMSALVLAVFAEHLAYASGARHFVLCITNACRRQLHPDIDRVVGNFTGVVVFEADLRGAPGFRDTAIRLRDRLALDLEHADFDGVEVQRALARARGSQADAVIPVVFTGLLEQHGAVATDAAARERGFLDLRRSIHGVSQTSQVALDCTAVAVADTIEIFLDAVEAALPCQLLDEMRDGFAASLQRLADPASWTGQLIAGPDQDVLLRRFPLPQAPDAPAWAAQCRLLHEPVFRAMDRYPNAVALDWPGGTLRYAALRAAVARLAAQIAARGARRGELVAIVMEKGPEQIVAVLAILAAGAAYVPIDALLPPRRQADMVAIAETRMVVTQPHLATDVASLGAADILLVDLELPEAATSPADWRPAPVHHSDLAYVIFTSGSTGAPKGVMMEHAAALNTVRDICERVSVTQDDAVLSVSSLGFDLSVWDIFGVLGSGGRLVLPAASALADPSGWAERVETRRVTLWNSVPALAKLLAEAAGARPGALACLRAALLSGDWIPLDLPMQLRRLRPGLRLLALGGATEAAIWSIGHEIADTPHTGNSIPYGRALAGQTVSVRDAELRECPDLVVGEICIGGIGLARGYWRDPLRTARRFVTHPQTGERLYLTGDLGRVATDGEIILLGRADHQIKLNGHRLELGEVEHALERHPGISRAIVLVDQPSSAVRRLVAHVLPAPHALQDQRPEEPGAALRAVARPEAEALDFAGALEAGWRAAFRSDTETGTAAADMDAHIGRMTDTYLVSVLHALAELGLFTAPGECRRSDQVTGSGLVEPRYRRWLDRAFAYLAQDGALRALPDGSYQCEAPLRLRAARALDRASRPRPEPWLAGILRGSDSAAERYVAESMAAAYRDTFMHSNMVAAEAAEALLARRPGQAFGLLEVGAGYGSLTEHLLPLLAPQDTYLFTDVSPFFLNRARDVFAHPGLGFGMLDLDRAPECQGYAGSRFDVIVAASVLHAVKDIRRTLRRLTSLLKPGGALLLIEETAFYPFFDLGMGLQAGFDSFTDTALRPHHPLLSRDAWRRELEAAGFAAATVFARGDRVMDRLGFDVILTRGPALVPAVDEFALRDFLEAHLPVHAVPREFRLLTELPLTGNGKIDRAALAASPAARPAAVQPSPPQTPEEQALAPIWQAVLQLDQVSTAENFFAAGGDSLLAARLAMQLRAGFGITLPVRAIFEAPVFSDLAVLVGLARAAAALPGETLVSGEL